jgi:hypothetical protein
MRILEKLKRTPRFGPAIVGWISGGLPLAGRHASTANPAIWPVTGPGRTSGNAGTATGYILNRGMHQGVSAPAPEPVPRNDDGFQPSRMTALLESAISQTLAGLMDGGDFHPYDTLILPQAFAPGKSAPRAWRCLMAGPGHRTDSR